MSLSSATGRSLTVRMCALVAGLLILWCSSVGQAKADKWSGLASWPLIPIHAVLLPDGRMLTYGTNAALQQTGKFIYDVWDPRLGFVAASHLTPPNGTGTDIFCNAQLLLP